jgi:hypothetical protein
LIWCVCLDETWLNLQIESVPLSLSLKKKKCQTFEIQNGLKNGDFKLIFPVKLGKKWCYIEKEKKNFRIFIYWSVKLRLPFYVKAFLTPNLRNKLVNMANLVTLNQFKCLVSPFKMLQIFFCIIFSLLDFLYFLPLHFFRSIIISLFSYIRTKTTLTF